MVISADKDKRSLIAGQKVWGRLTSRGEDKAASHSSIVLRSASIPDP